jgi:thiol-disulfide isomerase/thioredoxin
MRPALPALFLGLALSLSACRRSVDVNDADGHRGFVIVGVTPSAGDLPTLLKAEAAKAKAQGLKPHVELWAPWCGPCRAIKKGLNDPQMLEAFKGTYIVQLNVDDWSSTPVGSGFTWNKIPVFFALDDEGKPTGRKIDGEAWNNKAYVPENMASPLGRFFHGT